MLVVFYVVCVLHLYHILFRICLIFCIFQLCGPLVAEGNKLYGREPEVEFVTHVTHGGSVKFLPAGEISPETTRVAI